VTASGGGGSDAIKNAGLLLLDVFPSACVRGIRLVPVDGKMKRPGVGCGVDVGSLTSTLRRFGDEGK
jgi:hypothetical protein